MDGAALEPEVQRVGRELAAALPQGPRGPLRALDDRAMEFASQDAELKAALFRFVDVVPACRSLDDLARHLTAFLADVDEPPPPISAAMRMGGSRAGRAALGAASAAGVRRMAHRFIVGASAADAGGVLRSLWSEGIGSSVDLLGEATVTAPEADAYAQRCHAALDQLTAVYAPLEPRPLLERDAAGPTPRVNLSVKVSALTPLLRPAAPALGQRDAADRLRPLLRRARDVGAHLHIDMESLDSREAVSGLVLELLSEDEFRAGPSAGVVLQAYLRDSGELLDRLIAWAGEHERAVPLTVRLVKGAYWDHEVVEARQHGWHPPVFEEKAESDRSFEELTLRLLEARPALRVAIASHNVRSVAHALAAGRALGGGPADVEFQVLRGLGDDLGSALVQDRQSRAHVLPGRRPRRRDGLPRAPAAREHEQRQLPARPGLGRADRAAAGGAVSPLPPFANEPLLELRRASERDALVAALADLEGELPLRVPVWIGDERREGDELVSTDPGAPERVVALAAVASAAEVARAVDVAHGALCRPGPSGPPRSARRRCCARPRCCARAACASPRSRCASARSPGTRPTATSARRSTSSSTTRAGRSSSRACRPRCSSCPVSATRCATARAA